MHASLRGAGCRWNAQKWLATGSGADMAAYTASLTAQAPFVRTATQKQLSYKKAFKRVIKEAIATAVDYGRLPPEVFELLDIQVEAPSIPYKSALDEAQANQIRVQGGWKSRQTVQQEEGLDPEREMQNIEEYNRRMGTAEKQGPVRVHEANFNPNEPRDWRGRWTKADGGIPPTGYQVPTDPSRKNPLTTDELSQLVSPRHQDNVYTATAAELGSDGRPAAGPFEPAAGSVEYFPLGMSGAVHSADAPRNWDEDAVLESLRKADPDMYEFIKKHKFVMQMFETGWYQRNIVPAGPRFAVKEIDGKKRNVLEIPDFLSSEEAAMGIAFWLEHDCPDYKKWSAEQAGPPS